MNASASAVCSCSNFLRLRLFLQICLLLLFHEYCASLLQRRLRFPFLSALPGIFDLMSSTYYILTHGQLAIDTQIQKVRGVGGRLERPPMQNARYPMGTQYTQNSLCHIQIFLCRTRVIPVLEVLLLRQYQLLDGTVWFCILLLFFNTKSRTGPSNEGGGVNNTGNQIKVAP